MRIRRKNINRMKINVEELQELSFVLYLCIPLLTAVVNLFSRSIAITIAIIIAYSPLVFASLIRRKRITTDFWGMFFFLIIFIFITYIIHPNYEEWFTRSTYGIWDYVLRPDNGIYIYLFIRVLNNPKRLIKSICSAGWLMLLYYGYKVSEALQRGYWIDTSNRGYEIRMSYNLGLGYHVLFFTLMFLFCALEYKDIKGWIGTIIGVSIIGIAGSRGPFLCFLIFFVLYLGVKFIDTRKKALYLFAFIIGALILWLTLPYIFDLLIQVLDTLHLPSRIVKKIADGTMSDDSRRYIIWDATIQMIRKNPLGYGALGSRHIISKYIYAAYPHNVFLEIWVDFGVILGTVIIGIMAIVSFRIFTMKENEEWRGIFIVFFANACQLFISLTYWHAKGLWGALAVGVCVMKTQKWRKIQNVE